MVSWIITLCYASRWTARVVFIRQDVIMVFHKGQNTCIVTFDHLHLDGSWSLNAFEKLVHSTKNQIFVSVHVYFDVVGSWNFF